MDNDQKHFIRDALLASVTELFAWYGSPCVIVPDAPESETADGVELGSVIGFRGRGVCGGFAFVAPLPLIVALLPVPRDATQTDMQLRDWGAEIANQIVGRLKNKLNARSLDFDAGTPVCFTGKSIRLVFLPDMQGLSLSFRVGETAVRIHLDCSIAEEIAYANAEHLAIVPEGELLLF